jgi:P-type Cu2+ transporter
LTIIGQGVFVLTQEQASGGRRVARAHEMHDGEHPSTGSAHEGHGGRTTSGGHGGGHAGHDRHAGHTIGMFRDRFWVSLVLSVPVVLYSEMVQMWLGFSMPRFPGSGWVALVLGTFIFLWGGWPFLKGGFEEARGRRPGMMLLISMAITVAFLASAATTLGFFDLDFWWELALLVTIMLLGHWMEMRAVGQASGALEALAALLPDEAERVIDGTIEKVTIEDLGEGDVVLVRSGGRVPADGEIVEGEAEIDESMITGESKPAPKGAGEKVVAGTVATDSSIRVRITAVGEETTLAGIQRLVEEAQGSSSRAQSLADRAAALLFYVATAAGAITFVVWLALGQPGRAIENTVTVLVISCPHALGLAIPLVIAIATGLSARNGILVKDRLSLESMRTVDTVLFDKTGTLTRGEPAVAGVAVAEGFDGDEEVLLGLAAAVEADSEHPLARAIVAAGEKGGVPTAGNFRSLTGRGVEAEVGGSAVAVGGPSLLRERGLEEPADLVGAVETWKARGATILHVIRDGRIAGALALEDEIRPESREAVKALHEQGIRVVMITGDAKQVADTVAADLGIDEVFAEVLPEDKDKAVAELQRRGERVAMVGDGVNDAPALARADVGIAIGAGTDVAIESAGVVLAQSDPRAVLGVVELSKAGYRKMLQNLFWAAGYNVVAIPLAAGVLAPAGILLSPAVGAVLMSLSTIIVALNAQLLRHLDLRPSRA